MRTLLLSIALEDFNRLLTRVIKSQAHRQWHCSSGSLHHLGWGDTCLVEQANYTRLQVCGPVCWISCNAQRGWYDVTSLI